MKRASGIERGVDGGLDGAMSDPVVRSLVRAFGVVFFAMFVGLGAQVSIPMPPFGIPQTLQTLAVVLAAMCLGPRLGMASMALYAVSGVLGAGLFADGETGLGVLLGQTGGYIVGFALCQPVIVRVIRRRDGSIRGWGAMFLSGVAGHAVIFAIGVPWLYYVRATDPNAAITWGDACWHGCVVFLPNMVLKCTVAMVIGVYASPWAAKKFW
ncbi:MAG: biotin transporter BioY [Phycisphaerales bacterium]|jgi:biotin transport system substrate-specific component|nr:biotin transporter BioY [Phycisphaerales bacterium]